MVRKFLDRCKENKGFTLIEMLIVVAIVGILIAISIPMFSSSLEDARNATDAANERSAKSSILMLLMTNDPLGTEITKTKPGICYYDASEGKIVKDKGTIKSYGKASECKSTLQEKCGGHKDKVVKMEITGDNNENIKTSWE